MWAPNPDLDAWAERQRQKAEQLIKDWPKRWGELCKDHPTQRCDRGCGRQLNTKTKGLILDNDKPRPKLYCGACRLYYRKQFGNVGWAPE